ncbi:hypothetical protein ACHAXM_006394 [Skeletonema potamos]|jgi:hypothetical protein
MKFISTVLTLLLAAPSASAADLPPVRTTRRRLGRDRKLGGVGGDGASIMFDSAAFAKAKGMPPPSSTSARTRMTEEVDVADMPNGNSNAGSCAESSPIVAVEQLMLAYSLSYIADDFMYQFESDFSDFPSLDKLLGDSDPYDWYDLFFFINGMLADMSCGDYVKEEKNSLFLVNMIGSGWFFPGMEGSKGFFNSTLTPKNSSNSTLTPEDSSP